jgi:limonene-1,2-epoxide hydrolase
MTPADSTNSTNSTNSTERNKATAARFWVALYAHDWDAVASFFTTDANYVDVGTGETGGGAHGPDQIVARLRLGLDPVDAHNHVDGMVLAEGNAVITEHAEEWVFSTGERVLHPFASVMVFSEDGLIERWWDYSNLSNLLDNAPAWWIEHIAQGYRDLN